MKVFPVFVYGTLRKGYRLNAILEDSYFIGTFKTEEKFSMFTMGAFPAVIPNKDGVQIAGEVYEVTASVLKELDDVEGVPYHYERIVVNVIGYGRAYMYSYRESDTERVQNQKKIHNGDWSTFAKPIQLGYGGKFRS